MSVDDLSIWIEDNARSGTLWYLKRLSGNDTLANGTHQAGPYVPKRVLFDAIPELDRPEALNPDHWLNFQLASHDDERDVRAVWYNNSLHGGTRNEARLTNFGGAGSAILDPENTGAIAVFVFHPAAGETASRIAGWVTRSADEEDLIISSFGEVEPQQSVLWSPDGSVRTEAPAVADGALPDDAIPASWLEDFPKAAEIVARTIELGAFSDLGPDERLLRRRDLEFKLFRRLEELTEMARIKAGFDTIDSFIKVAQTILQRRKARSGRSLELHLKAIFLEEGLTEDEHFEHGATIEGGKKPDFLFPTAAHYENEDTPDANLSMLAVKTTCRDRWRQILNEADRIPEKHLFTLQEGVSETQFAEMTTAGVKLVLPTPLHDKFAASIAPQLMSLQEFIEQRSS